MGIYTACVTFTSYIAHADGRMMFENPSLVERAKEVNDKMVDTIKRLSTFNQSL